MAKKSKEDNDQYGFKGKTADLDRLGIFAEMSYLSGKGFRYEPQSKGKRKTLDKGPHMQFVATKSRSGNQDGYFEKPFPRIFQGEALKTPRKKARKKKGDEEIPFRFVRVTKKHSTPGDFYGTFFTNPLAAMDPRQRKKPKRVPALPNLKTNPAKEGGSGYADITLSKYPPYMSPKTRSVKKDQVDEKRVFHTANKSGQYFTENPYRMDNEPKVLLYVKPVEGKTKQQLFKLLERSMTEPPKKKKIVPPSLFIPPAPPKKGVYFSKITYTVIPKLVKKRTERKMASSELVMRPTWGTKPYPQRSIISYNVDLSVNITNWGDFKPFVYA